MKKNILLALGLATTVVATGCTDTSSDTVQTDSGAYGSRGLALTTDFLGGTDVAGMRYKIEKCGGGEVLSADHDLEDLQLPGGIWAFENKPFDEDSQHIFADHFVMLPAGCYDVKVTPLTKYGKPSKDCASAYAQDVTVVDQLTTEILLVSQCQGPERGALDVVGALNHPPVIMSLKYGDSKFMTCDENGKTETVFCAKASDPDSDPLEFEWSQVGGPPVKYGPSVISHETGDGWEKECVKVKLPYGSGAYEFMLKVYDMFHSEYTNGVEPNGAGQNGVSPLIRAETWFALNGYGEVDSHAKLRFPLYVSCEGHEYCYDRYGKKSECHEDRCYDENRYEIDCPVDEVSCPHSQGYWKNHNKYAKNPSQKIPWPISEDTKMCGITWLNILNTPAGGDGFYILAYQYIAAKLNLANGGPTSPALLAKMEEAAELLNKCKSMKTGPNKSKATALADYLEKYNTNKLLDCRKDDESCPKY